MPNFKLTYFNMTGPAEPIRYLLSYMNQPFEDCRFELEAWVAIRDSNYILNF